MKYILFFLISFSIFANESETHCYNIEDPEEQTICFNKIESNEPAETSNTYSLLYAVCIDQSETQTECSNFNK